MIIISHRSNLNGKNPQLENNPNQIELALKNGFEVEIDVWFINRSFYLGHDHPQYPISEDYLTKPGLWCHAKNIDSLERMLYNGSIHCFYHENDKYTLTNKGIIWCFPGNKIHSFYPNITVLPEKTNTIVHSSLFGICTDYPEYYRKFLESYAQ